MRGAFLQIVPQARELDEAGWRRSGNSDVRRSTLTDWSIGEAVATILSPEAIASRPTPSATTRASVRTTLATRSNTCWARATRPARRACRSTAWTGSRASSRHGSRSCGGTVRLGHDVQRVDIGEGSVIIGFADGLGVRAKRLVLTLPIPALEALAEASPVINGPTWRRLYRSIEGFPATKLYCWYDRPWWRDGVDAPTGLRTTTDLPNRMIFYFDEAPDRPAAMLAAYTDGRETSRSLRWQTAGAGDRRPHRRS